VIDDYFRELNDLIAATSLVTAIIFHTERRSESIGFVRGDLTFIDGSRLHFREFVRKEEDKQAIRYTYVYHYQDADGQLIFRYDNTSHFPTLENAPHHKHISSEVIPTEAPDLIIVLKEIDNNLTE